MRQVRLEHLNTRSFEAGGFTAAIVPIGACESHGDHMPFGTDAITAHALAMRVAERLQATFVLPPLYFGMSEHYRHKPICISMSNDTEIRVITDILRSLHHWGIKRILILNGHDGNIPCAEIAARDFKVAHREVSVAIFDWWTVIPHFLPKETFAVWSGWGHAGEIEASIGLSLFPDLMDMENARGMVPKTDPIIKEIWLFDELTRHGASGDPTFGTKEKGGKIASAVIDYLVQYMLRFEKDNLVFPEQVRDATG